MTVVALSGGVGGAKLALGLYRALPPDTLTVVVNTADDFDHLGLRICPDLDTVLYTLAGLAHPTQGWGRQNETWTLMRALESFGADIWFRLGDGDTALHLVRTENLRHGVPLTDVIREFRTKLRIAAQILPMTDSRVETRVDTDEGELAFQDYFVRRRCEPHVRAICFAGAAQAELTSSVRAAFEDSALDAIIVCPSNPYLSIDPLLSIEPLRAALASRRVPAIAISPLIGGTAVKGPTAKIMRELGIESTPASIAAHYRDLIDALIVDTSDSAETLGLGMPAYSTSTLMRTLEDRIRLARFVLRCAHELRSPRRPT